MTGWKKVFLKAFFLKVDGVCLTSTVSSYFKSESVPEHLETGILWEVGLLLTQEARELHRRGSRGSPRWSVL